MPDYGVEHLTCFVSGLLLVSLGGLFACGIGLGVWPAVAVGGALIALSVVFKEVDRRWEK